MAFRVFIDPGHGGSDPGAVYQERKEKDDVLQLALLVGQILSDHGIDVVYSRTEDYYDSPYEKAVKANESEADLLLSIHRNAALFPGSGTGADLLVYADTGFAGETADNIGKEIAQAGLRFNGITERPNLAVLRRSKMPAVLVEAGFIDNESDNRFFDENLQKLAQGIAQGVLDTLEIEAASIPQTLEEPPLPDEPYIPPEIVLPPESQEPPPAVPPAEEPDPPAAPPIEKPKPPEVPPAGPGPVIPPAPEVKPPKLYRVQVGAFTNPMFATQLLNQLLLEGFPAFIVFSDGLYRVQVGAFTELDNAVRMEKSLRRQGYQTYITT